MVFWNGAACSCKLQSKAEIYCTLPHCTDCHVSVLPEFVFHLSNVQNKVFKKTLPLLTGMNYQLINFLDQQQKPITLRQWFKVPTPLSHFRVPEYLKALSKAKPRAFLLFPILCTVPSFPAVPSSGI